jgi:hypothetical protein
LLNNKESDLKARQRKAEEVQKEFDLKMKLEEDAL